MRIDVVDAGEIIRIEMFIAAKKTGSGNLRCDSQFLVA